MDPLRKRTIANKRSTTWLGAQHHLGDIAQPAEQQLAPHAVAPLAAMGRIRPIRRSTPPRGAAGAASAGPAAALGRAGRERVRLRCTRLPR